MLLLTALLGLVPLLAPLPALAAPSMDTGAGRLVGRADDNIVVNVPKPCTAKLNEQSGPPCGGAQSCLSSNANPCVNDDFSVPRRLDDDAARSVLELSERTFPFLQGHEYRGESQLSHEEQQSVYELGTALEAQGRDNARFQGLARIYQSSDSTSRDQWLKGVVVKMVDGAWSLVKNRITLWVVVLGLMATMFALASTGHTMAAVGTGLADAALIIALIIRTLTAAWERREEEERAARRRAMILWGL